MSRPFAAGLLFLLVFTSPPAIAQQSADAGATYASLVERVKSGDQTIDFRQLRLAYADSTGHRDTDKEKKNMVAALTSKDFKKAMQNAETVLASDFVDMEAHFAMFIANSELKIPDKAAFHKFVLQSLLKSITDSGDGQTPQTAYQVIEVHEEYVILQFLGAELPESQSAVNENGHSYDQIKFKDPKSGEPVTIYFNVDIPMKAFKDLK